MQRKLALITGASRGIGRAAAMKFAENGFDLILTCFQNTELLQELSEQLQEQFKIQCLPFTGDMGCFSEAEALYQAARLRFGSRPADVIINNAGISQIGLLTELSPEDWNRILATNLTSVFNVCRLFVPDMVSKKSGRIINISSVWGIAGASCEVAYSASKGGVNAFTKALAKELAPSHIPVNAIAFGVIDTDMNACFSEEEKRQLTEEIPFNRMGTPEEAADMIYCLAASPNYLTGQIIPMDGGFI